MNEGLIIRPARPEDSRAVNDMGAAIWDGQDYVPGIFDEWLNDVNGELLVGVHDGDPVALIKISDLGHGDAWLQGLRVRESAQGRGYGRTMLEYALQLARRENFKTIRLMTTDDNRAVQHIVASLGFRPVATGSWFYGRPTHTRASLVPLDELHYEWLLEQVVESPELMRTRGFYAFRWQFYTLTPGRLRDHLQMGEIYALSGGNAWAIVDLDEPDIGFGQGPADELTELLRDVLNHPDLEGDEMHVLTPPEGELAQALLSAGFQPEKENEICYQWFGDTPQEAR